MHHHINYKFIAAYTLRVCKWMRSATPPTKTKGSG